MQTINQSSFSDFLNVKKAFQKMVLNSPQFSSFHTFTDPFVSKALFKSSLINTEKHRLTFFILWQTPFSDSYSLPPLSTNSRCGGLPSIGIHLLALQVLLNAEILQPALQKFRGKIFPLKINLNFSSQ